MMRRVVNFLRSSLAHDVWTLFAMLLALSAGLLSWYASDDAREAVMRIQREEMREDREGRSRRHQTCTRDERRFAREVRDLEQTYAYFLGLSPAERKTDRIASVIDLDDVERETRDERPPRFCSESGVGLPPKQVPRIPERPRELRWR